MVLHGGDVDVIGTISGAEHLFRLTEGGIVIDEIPEIIDVHGQVVHEEHLVESVFAVDLFPVVEVGAVGVNVGGIVALSLIHIGEGVLLHAGF